VNLNLKIQVFWNIIHALPTGKYSGTSNNGHCRGIQILSVIGGALVGVRQVTYGGDSGNRIFVLYWRCPLIRVSVIRGSTVLMF
jgi:hypothetical protein